MTDTPHALIQMGYQEWNRRLLRYYFGDEPSEPGWHRPVTHLHVTAEDLQQAAGNPAASPSDVRASFLGMFSSEHRTRTFSTVASDNDEWKPTAYDEPPFFVHLVLSCLIATDFESEDAFSARLNEACANGMQNSTEALPQLWNQLRDWLENARQRGASYRSLILPARRERGWTNIGYTIDLAFPRRGDRDELLELFRRLLLWGREPTISGVLAALEGRTNRFSLQFNEVFADFRRTVERGEPRWNHAFWSAVRDACMASSEAGLVEVQLLISPDPIGFRPYLLSRAEEDACQLGFEAKAFRMLDEWPFAIHSGNNYEQPVHALLAGGLAVKRIASCVENGMLLFSPLQEDVWGWTPPHGVRHSTHAFVRGDQLQRFRAVARQRSGAPPMRERPSRFGEWFELENFEIVQLSAETRDIGTLTPPVIEIDSESGVRIRDGWLGEDGLLPHLVAQRAQSVHVRPLEDHPDSAPAVDALEVDPQLGTWCFPRGRLDGAFLAEATFADGTTSALHIRFYGTPLHTRFPAPTPAQVERSFVEGSNLDVLPLDARVPVFMSTSDHSYDHMDLVSDAIYLGPTVGEWSDVKCAGFEWLLAPNVQPRLRFVGDLTHPTLPTGTSVECKPAARAWRRCFGRADVAGPMDVIHAYKAVARRVPLPTSGIAGTRFPKSIIDEPRAATPDPGVMRFNAALTAIAVQRPVISQAELLRLVGLAFGLKDQWRLRFALLRSWVEAGVLEEASDSRWSARRYVTRRPRLVLYRFGNRVRAAVVGLLAPAVSRQLEKLTETSGGRFDPRCSMSEWAPSVPLLDFPSTEGLAVITNDLEFAEPEWLPSLPSLVECVSKFAKAPMSTVDLPRQLRIQTWDWEKGMFQEGEVQGTGVSLYRCSAHNQPDRFEIRTDDRRGWSTLSRVWAFLAAHHLRAECAFENDDLLVRTRVTSGAQLPMPLARSIAILSPATGGAVNISGRLRYQYWLPSARAVRLILVDAFATDTDG